MARKDMYIGRNRVCVYLNPKAERMYDVLKMAGINISQEINTILMAKYNQEAFQKIINDKQKELDELIRLSKNLDLVWKPEVKQRLHMPKEQKDFLIGMMSTDILKDQKAVQERLKVFNKKFGTNINSLKEIEQYGISFM